MNAIRLMAIVALLCAACGDDDSTTDGGIPPGSDAGPATDAGPPPDGEVPEIDAYLPEGPVDVPDDTVLTVPQDDGSELGVSTVGDDGVARFYSEAREAYLEYALSHEDDDGEVDADTEVYLVLGTDGRMSTLVLDPLGVTMPIAYQAEMPTTGAHTLEVDPLELATSDTTVLEYEEEPTDPFGDFTVAGISVSISIGGIVRGMVSGAVVSAFAGLVGGACNAVAPLHDEICDVLVTVVEIAGNLVVPGFKLLRGSIGLGEFIIKEVGLGQLLPFACKEGAAAITKALNEENEAQVNALRDNYRRAVGEYHYLLHQLETDPPEDPGDAAAMRAGLVDIGALLSSIGPQLREGYVEIHALEGPRPSEEPSPYNRARPHLLRLINNTTFGRVEWETVFEAELMRAIFIRTDDFTIVGTETMRIQVSERTIRELAEVNRAIEVGGWIADCALGVYQGIEAEIQDGLARRMAVLEMPVFFDETIDAALAANQELYDNYYGGGDIPVPCEFDEYEPNASWEAALASPTSAGVGEGPVWLRSLTLCSVDGTPIEEDWYAFPMAAIEFQVQARVRTPEDSDFADEYADGSDEPICVDVYYYGQTNEIIGDPPTYLYGGCGTPEDTWTGSHGVRRAIGEAWSYILIHVRAEDGAMDPIGYDLGFAE